MPSGAQKALNERTKVQAIEAARESYRGGLFFVFEESGGTEAAALREANRTRHFGPKEQLKAEIHRN